MATSLNSAHDLARTFASLSFHRMPVFDVRIREVLDSELIVLLNVEQFMHPQSRIRSERTASLPSIRFDRDALVKHKLHQTQAASL